jgi:putative flippase GtrA
MKNFLKKLAALVDGPHGEAIRYVVIGGLTTFVDYASFYLMDRVLLIDLTVSNIVSTALAILFAYVDEQAVRLSVPYKPLLGILR